MNPELPDDIEIGYSSTRWLPLFGFALTMALLSAAIALDWIVGGEAWLRRTAGYAGMACFGLMAARFAWALFAERRPVLLVSRDGIRDLRIANEFILWESVTDVTACRVGRQNFVVLKLTPAVEQRLFCADTAQAMLAANRALGLDGIAISPLGLATDFDGLLATCSGYFAAARRAADPEQRSSGASSRWSPGYA